ncbi:MAG: nickel pincer cofactor biosynthesis protein LarC [Lentisphaeria bacterium]|jgi:hypothetical protein
MSTCLLVDPVMGASGDMILGALFDLGADPAAVERLLHAIGLTEVHLEFRQVEAEHRIRYGRCEVRIAAEGEGHHAAGGHGHGHGRNLPGILAMLASPALPPRARDRAERIFQRLAAAEAAVHGIAVEQVHFHEVGAADAIADIVGACLALEQLGVERLHCGPLKAGTGTIRCAHGILPNPAPATVKLQEGFPVIQLPIAAELTTPTGAAILTTLSAGDWSGRPFRWLRSGAGCGLRKLAEGPNILRLILAEEPAAAAAAAHLAPEAIEILETDIDDDSPEVTATLPDLLRQAGALDVTLTPLLMKKGRPGVRLTALLPPGRVAEFATLVLTHGSAIGLRHWPARRLVLERGPATLATPWGEVAAKRIVRPDGRVEVTPEFDSCRELAQRANLPLRRVMAAARQAGGG